MAQKNQDLGNEVYNKHIYVHLALNGNDLKLIQFCCEFVEQFIGKGEKRHIELCKSFGTTHDEVYWFADKWSFDLRRYIETEYKKRMKLE